MLFKYTVKLLLSFILVVLSFSFLKSLSLVCKLPLAPNSLWFIGGFFLYIPIHIIFRRMIVVHVFGHELTHALWSVLFGGKVNELYVSSHRGGFTRYTRGNFLVTLAPYFFPLYALIFFGLSFIVMDEAKPVFSAFCGFSVCFHILLTNYSIRIGQPDIRQEGMFFSLPLILFMNILIIGIIFTGISGPGETVDFLTSGTHRFRVFTVDLIEKIPLYFQAITGKHSK